jgi:phosphoglycolate phosphatase-like HAD superfamily hydrolase
MNTIRAILFDVIGTTVLEDDPDLINSCFLKAFEQHSIYLDKAAILTIRGKDKRQAISEAVTFSGNDPALNNNIFQTFEQNVVDRISEFHEHPQFGELVDFLHARDVLIGVGSGLPQSLFEKLFDRLNWTKYSLDYVSTFEKFKFGRPHPLMIDDMRKIFDISKDEFLKVGDTVSDIEEGRKAGVYTAVILSGTQAKEHLISAKPTYLLKSLSDVKRLFAGEH